MALISTASVPGGAVALPVYSEVRIDVVVTVTEGRTAEGYVYRYRIENRSRYAIGVLYLGYEDAVNHPLLDIDPISIRAPAGWKGELASDEALVNLVWMQVDPSDRVHEVAPGATMEGFEVTLARPEPDLRTLPFTVYMTEAQHATGNVRPAPGSREDRRPPTVTLTAPAADAKLSGRVTVSADATDETGIADVRFLLDGEDMAGHLIEPHLDSPPYAATWSTYGLPNGAHTLTAVARDIAGNRGTSAGITVNLQNDERPLTISLTSPAGRATVSGTTALSASVSSGSRIMGVLFRVDGVNIGTWVTTAPWSIDWDTTSVPNGNRSLTATVMNQAGAVEQTPPMAVTVWNGTTSISETEPAKLWVGFKDGNEHGTPFDLRVALYVNNERVTEGVTRCVSHLSRNPSFPAVVTVPFGRISSHELAAGSVIALLVSTRIGTNSDGSRCGGHDNAGGLRVYYDAAGRPSQFGVRITPDPLKRFFLRSSGGSFLLDTTSPPVTQAKGKDSGPVTFAGGNPWREVGTWSRSIP